MNTNSNVYTVIYTTVIVVIVAAVLAFVAMTLKPKQDANVKAETVSQMLAAAQYASKDDLTALGNARILEKYSENIKSAFLINAAGEKVGELETAAGSIELADNLKEQNYTIKDGKDLALPVYLFDKDGADVYVIPVYGAGLWGPVWGYVAFNSDCTRIVGAYFDHSGETPGLGAKIKDEPSFREQFVGKSVALDGEKLFEIVKGGAPAGQANAVDAIAGATMTCKGLDAAINVWFAAYKPFLAAQMAAAGEGSCGSCAACGACTACDSCGACTACEDAAAEISSDNCKNGVCTFPADGNK